MLTEHLLFLVLGIAPKSRAKVCAQWRMSLSPPVACWLLTVLRRLFGVFPTKCFWSRCFVSLIVFFVVYLNVNGSGSITSVGEERTNLSAVVYL